MNLTELQIQLRSIEEQIAMLQTEIEKMKPKPEDEQKAMFEKITKMASQFPLENKQTISMSDTDVKTYLTCLAYVILADKNQIYERLLYICRLAYGLGITISAEDIFRMGLEVDKIYLDKACSELKNFRDSFLVDALILTNIGQEVTDVMFSLVADIAKILECDKEDIQVAAYVAKAVLLADFNVLKQIPVPSKNRWMGQFTQHIPTSWINSQRIKCDEICTEIKKTSASSTNSYYPLRTVIGDSTIDTQNPCVIKNRLQAEKIVKKGDELVVYEKIIPTGNSKESLMSNAFAYYGSCYSTIKNEVKKEKKTIVAPCDGVVFFITDEKYNSSKNETYIKTLVYVVSYFDDYTEFCDWHKKK